MSKKDQNLTDKQLLRLKAEEKLKKQSKKSPIRFWNPIQKSSFMNFRCTR